MALNTIKYNAQCLVTRQLFRSFRCQRYFLNDFFVVVFCFLRHPPGTPYTFDLCYSYKQDDQSEEGLHLAGIWVRMIHRAYISCRDCVSLALKKTWMSRGWRHCVRNYGLSTKIATRHGDKDMGWFVKSIGSKYVLTIEPSRPLNSIASLEGLTKPWA